jgi:N-glycosylase/DNA lyase
VFRWQRLEDGRWLGVDGGHWYLTQESAPGRLEVESNADAAAFRSLFRLDVDAEAFEREIVARAPELAPYLSAHAGLRVMRPSDPTEVFFSFLCSANNHIARITGMVERLAEYGPPLGVVEGRELRAFPRAEAIAEIPEAELRAKGFGYRAATITGAAREIARRGPNWIERLRELSYAEAHQELVALRGVGAKLADCIALFGLDKGEAVPVDTHVWQAATRLYFPEWQGASLTEGRYRAIGELFRGRFGELAGWAHQFLFFDNMERWRGRGKEKGQP